MEVTIWTQKTPIITSEIRKILIIQFGTYSNVFLSSSVFETIKNEFPEVTLDFLTKNPYQETVKDHPFLDNIIPIPKEKGINYLISRVKLFRQIAQSSYDLVIDYENNPFTKQITFFSKAKYRIGYSEKKFSIVYNYNMLQVDDKYIGSQKFDLLKPLGIVEKKWTFHYTITVESEVYIDEWLNRMGLKKDRFVVLAPGSLTPSKKWRNIYFAYLGDLIEDNLDLPIVLIGKNQEHSDCKIVYENMVHKPIIAPEMTLNQAVALIRRAKILICNDGGLNHLSCATQTQTIAIFGTTNPVLWSPSSVFAHHQHLYKEGYPSKSDDSFGISPQSVLECIKDMLNIN